MGPDSGEGHPRRADEPERKPDGKACCEPEPCAGPEPEANSGTDPENNTSSQPEGDPEGDSDSGLCDGSRSMSNQDPGSDPCHKGSRTPEPHSRTEPRTDIGRNFTSDGTVDRTHQDRKSVV